jgi:hypothetical protein
MIISEGNNKKIKGKFIEIFQRVNRKVSGWIQMLFFTLGNYYYFF